MHMAQMEGEAVEQIMKQRCLSTTRPFLPTMTASLLPRC